MGGFHGQPFSPGTEKTSAFKAALVALLLPAAAAQSLIHPALKRLLLGDGHLALHLKHLAGTELRMEGADQLQALEEHLHGTVVNGGGMVIQLIPGQFGIETDTVGSDLIFSELTWLPKPAVGVAVKPPPVEERVEVDRAATQLNAVLLQPSLLHILRLSRRHITKADGSGYPARLVPTSPQRNIKISRLTQTSHLRASLRYPVQMLMRKPAELQSDRHCLDHHGRIAAGFSESIDEDTTKQ